MRIQVMPVFISSWFPWRLFSGYVVEEIQLLFAIAKKYHTSLTFFRTAGTSLSGQSVTDGYW